MNHAKELLGAISQHYSRKYSQRMATDIADRYVWITPAFKEALYDEVIRIFEPSSTRPLPDMATLQKAERNLPRPESLESASGGQLALPGEGDGQLPSLCPFCGHPVNQYDYRDAICLGRFDERLGRKTGCGAEWELQGERWVQGYRSRGVWYDGPAPDLDTDWRKQLSGTPPEAETTIDDGRKAHYAMIKRLVDEGNATAEQEQWLRDYGKEKPKVPNVKHVSETLQQSAQDEAEAHW